MKTMMCCLAAFCLLSLGFGATEARAENPGQFTKTLSDKYCPPVTTAKGYGCFAYIHYRIDNDKTRSAALSACSWICNKMDDEQCHKGCSEALAMEKK